MVVAKNLQDLMRSREFALTELEPDLIHSTYSLLSPLGSSVNVVVKRFPNHPFIKTYSAMEPIIENIAKLFKQWVESIKEVSDGKYPWHLNELDAKEIMRIKVNVGEVTLQFIERLNPELTKLEKMFEPISKLRLRERFQKESFSNLIKMHEIVKERIKAMRTFVNSFLRVEKSNFDLREVANLNTIIREISGLTKYSRTRMKSGIRRRDIRVISRVPGGTNVPMNPQILRSTLLGATANAYKAISRKGPDGGTKGTITIDYKPTKTRHLVTVTDDGPGIPTAKRKEVWEWGKSGSESWGLGLPLAKTMAQASGGNTYFRSRTRSRGERKKGTTFVISLPKKPKRKPVTRPRG